MESNGRMDESAFASWLEDSLLRARTTEAITEIPHIEQFRENGPGGSFNTGLMFTFKDGSAFEVSIVASGEEF